MTTDELTLVCSGRPVDDHGQPVGEPCGRVFPRERWGRWQYLAVEDGDDVWIPVTDPAYFTAARSAGWAVGPNLEAMCPKCRRPDPELVKSCRELEKSCLPLERSVRR